MLVNETKFLDKGDSLHDDCKVKGQKCSQCMYKQYDTALRSIYDELYELNVTENNCKTIYNTEGKYFKIGYEDNLKKMIYSIAEKRIHPDDKSRFLKLCNAEYFRNEISRGIDSIIQEYRILLGSDEYSWTSFTIIPLKEGKIKDEIYLCFVMDISDKKRAEYDVLTGIYNVQGFSTRAEKLLQTNINEKYAVIRIDVNRFKFINDIYGIEEGDKLLKYIGNIIKNCTTVNDTYGRLNGDIFCLCVRYKTQENLIKLVEKISEQISSYSLGYKVVASFGICLVEDRKVPISILCDWANLALKTVKGNLIQKWAFYDDKLRQKQLEERVIEDEMEMALEKKQFSVYLQPKHDVKNNNIIGAEALIRWEHPTRGLISPGSFIPLFEKNGFIVRLDEYVWEEICKTLAKWIKEGYKPVPISMNVSRIHIYNYGFEKKILDLIEKYNLPSELIELELTESTFIENTGELYKIMEFLQKKGLSFSMDDFGSGYSSLNMLKSAPIDTIKLDREFLNETTVTNKGQTIIRHTIAMANQLKLNVVAEGVETEKQADFLVKAGCLIAQGYYFSKPMNIEEFQKLMFKK